jgi:hypothetical protein
MSRSTKWPASEKKSIMPNAMCFMQALTKVCIVEISAGYLVKRFRDI